MEYDLDFSETRPGAISGEYSVHVWRKQVENSVRLIFGEQNGISGRGERQHLLDQPQDPRRVLNKSRDYCDGGSAPGPGYCLEVDWVESNGHCGGASALHAVPDATPAVSLSAATLRAAGRNMFPTPAGRTCAWSTICRDGGRRSSGEKRSSLINGSRCRTQVMFKLHLRSLSTEL